MVETKHKRLYKKALSEGTLQEPGAVLAGAPFLAIGVFCMLFAARRVAPPLVMEKEILGILGLSFGGTFALIGGLYVLQCVWEGLRNLRRKSLAKLYRDAPWRADYEWKVSGTTEHVARQIAAKMPALVCLAKHPPVYWELQITADTPGVKYDALFILPVYAKH